MGFGGDLFWTVLAREYYKKNNKKVTFVHGNNKIYFTEMWINNPYISEEILPDTNIINLNKYSNLHKELHTEKNSSLQRCNFFGFNPTNLKPDLVYTEKEENKIKNLLKTLPEKFICIEPNAKTSWTPNRLYPFEKWQYIVNELVKNNINVIQVGIPGKKKLENVIDIRTKLSGIRETGCLLKYCNLFVSTDGGLTNVSGANGNKCLSIFTPMYSQNLTNPEIDNYHYIWIHTEDHKACHNIQFCRQCKEIMSNFDDNVIINEILKIYNK